MDIKNLFTDDDAVSPVIGVILMVAITVILAAVIGAFVLGIGSSQETVPNASFGFDYSVANDEIVVTHDGGDDIEAARLSLEFTGSGSASGWSSDPVGAGATNTWSDTGSGLAEGETLRVIWTSESGDSSQTLADFEVPQDSSSV